MYKKQFEFVQKKAEQGDVVHQTNLGDMYRYGNGVKQDYSKAIEWYTKAAERGYYDAIARLDSMKDISKN